jgi:hypothetical protein
MRIAIVAALLVCLTPLLAAAAPPGAADRTQFVRFADFGTEKDFDAAAEIYFPPAPENYWLWGNKKDPAQFIRYESPTSFYWVTKPRHAENFIAARVLFSYYSAKLRIKALPSPAPGFLAIRFKDNLLQPTSVQLQTGHDWKLLGEIGGKFDHQWKTAVLAFPTPLAHTDAGTYVVRIGRGDYGDLRGDLPITWVGLATKDPAVPPPTPGFWPDKLPSRFADLGHTLEYIPGRGPTFIAGVMVKGMRTGSWTQFARDHVNAIILQGWETQWKRGWEVYANGRYNDRVRAGFPDWMDQCARNKLLCSSQFFTDTRSYWIEHQYTNEDNALDAMSDVMKFNHNSPGNLGWYLKDEADHNDATWGAPPEFILQLYNLEKKADPERPAIVLFQGWKPDAFRAYDGAFDIAAFDVYPLGVGRPITDISERIENMRKEVGPTKALWAVVEGHEGEHVRNTGKRLTAAETLAQGYLCLTHDINGVIYFVDNEAEYIDVGEMPEPWEGMKQFFAEVNGPDGLGSWLLPSATTVARTGQAGSDGVDADAVHFIHKRLPSGVNLVIALNTRNATIEDVTFTLDGLQPAGEVGVRFEERTLRANPQGKLVDSFRPYERHIYQWK